MKKYLLFLVCMVVLLSSSVTAFAGESSNDSTFDRKYYNDLKVQYVKAVENDDFDKQSELIDLANQFLDEYIENMGNTQMTRANLYSKYFLSSSWISRSGITSLSITPNYNVIGTWGGANSETESWNALYGRHGGDSKWMNTSSMKKQFICHINWAGSWKVPWNLEPSNTNPNPITCN